MSGVWLYEVTVEAVGARSAGDASTTRAAVAFRSGLISSTAQAKQSRDREGADVAGFGLGGPWLQPWGTRILGRRFESPTPEGAGHPSYRHVAGGPGSSRWSRDSSFEA